MKWISLAVCGVIAACGGNTDSEPSSGASCEIGGVVHEDGATWDDADGCNGCSCSDGQAVCTARYCGDPDAPTCSDVRAQAAEELASLQACSQAAECGQVLEGTSCGCTRDLVLRLDADPETYEIILASEVDGELCEQPSSTCDCPYAEGFACVEGLCAWNYVEEPAEPACTSREAVGFCVVGSSEGLEEELNVGEALQVMVNAGCFGSSCTRFDVASCTATHDEDFELTADFCFADTNGGDDGCTADCSGGGITWCDSEALLTEGTHTVRMGELSLEITVPSTLPSSGLCAGNVW
jgi:hypothetical protein